MKVVVILGAHAVGKMTVGQALSRITGFRLLHNHMTIEFVNQFFDVFHSEEGKRLNSLFKHEILKAVAQSDYDGFIYTCMVAFDDPKSYEGLNSVLEMFVSHGAEIFVVELVADFDVRIERNKTPNRILNKPSKANIEQSEKVFRQIEAAHRMVSNREDVHFDNYMRIDNTSLSPEQVANMIRERFRV